MAEKKERKKEGLNVEFLSRGIFYLSETQEVGFARRSSSCVRCTIACCLEQHNPSSRLQQSSHHDVRFLIRDTTRSHDRPSARIQPNHVCTSSSSCAEYFHFRVKNMQRVG